MKLVLCLWLPLERLLVLVYPYEETSPFIRRIGCLIFKLELINQVMLNIHNHWNDHGFFI